MVQRRWPLELRVRQVVEAHRERNDRHRRRRPCEIFRPRRLGRASAGHQDARRRADERRLRRRLVGNGRRRHARQCGRDPRQDELRGWRRGQAPHRLGLRRQGDGRAGRRQDRALHRRRSRVRRQHCAVCGRRRLGPRRLRGRADPSPARRRSEAHAWPCAWAGLVRHRPRLARAGRQARRAAR